MSEALKTIYEGLASKNPQLKEYGFDSFSKDMQDEARLKSVYEGLARKNKQLADYGFDGFKTDVYGQPTQETTDYGPFDKETVEKSPQARQNFERWQGEQEQTIDTTKESQPLGQYQQKYGMYGGGVNLDTKQGIVKELGKRGQRSGWELNKMLANTPDFVNRIVVEAFNISPVGQAVQGVGDIAEKLGLIETAENWRMQAADLRPEQINEYIDNQKQILTKEIAKINPKHEMGIMEAAQQGDWETFSRNLAGGVADSFAPSLAMMISGGTMGTAGMIGSSTAVFGAGKYAEMDEQAPELPEQTKVLAAAVNGSLEGIFETYLGSGAVGAAIRKIATKEGRDAATGIVNKGIRQGFVDLLIKHPALAPLGEGFEEMGTQIAQNYVDKVSGYKPDINIMDGVIDAGLIGALAGATHTAPLYGAKAIFESGNNQQPATPEQQPFTVGDQATPPITEEQFNQMSPKEKAILDVTNEINQTLDKNGQVTMIRTGDEKNPQEYFVFDPDASQTGIVIVYDPSAPGGKKGIQVGEIMGNPVTIPVEQVIADKIAELDQREAVSKELEQNVIDIEGKKYVYISEQDGNVVLQEITQDELGNLTPVENQYLIRDKEEFGALLAEKQAELQREQVVEDKVTETVTGTKPVERPIVTQTIGKSQIDFIEQEGYDEVVPNEKMPLEKILPILEKKFKDNPKFKVEAEKVVTEIPGRVIKGETKWDDDIVEPGTTQTTIKSIKIVPINNQNVTTTPSQDSKVSENVNTDEKLSPQVGEIQQAEGTVIEQGKVNAEEAQADIEKRRQEELQRKNDEITNKLSELETKKENGTATINELDGIQQIKYYRDNYLQDDLNKINTKYDTELAELVNNSENNPQKLAESANNLNQDFNKVPETPQNEADIQTTKDLVTPESSQKVEPGVEGSEQKLQTPTDSQEKPSEIKEAVSASEPYQMTVREYKEANKPERIQKLENTLTAPNINDHKDIKNDAQQQVDEYYNSEDLLHKELVKQALTEGKQVYEGWQNDYPELAKQFETSNLAQAEAEVNQNPTEAQKEAGNYKKGHIEVAGFDITIESTKGSNRTGRDKTGKKWSVKLNNTYGYFKRSKGKDGDQIDVFLGENLNPEKVYVIDQNNEKGEFDESKVMLGFDSVEQAKEAYLSNYSPGWKGLGQITEVGINNFKTWLNDGKRQNKPFGDYKDTPAPVTTPELTQHQETGIDFVFKQNPELSQIGTIDQYSEYLDTIFPDSEVKDIVYHGSSSKDRFDNPITKRSGWDDGFYLTKEKQYADNFAWDGHTLAALVNIQNPTLPTEKIIAGNLKLNKGSDAIIGKEMGGENESIVIFNPEKIHILGSSKDIEGFRNYVKTPVTPELTEEQKPSYNVPESFNLNSFAEFEKALNNGDVALAEFKQAFEVLKTSKETIISELNGKTKAELLQNMNGMGLYRYKNEKKDAIVKALFSDNLMTFAFNTISYDPFGGTMEDAIAKKIAKTTQQDIDNYVQETKQRRADYIAQLEKRKKALTNPETLEEFKIFIDRKGISELSPEQKAVYDNLVTDKVIDKRKEAVENKSVVEKVELGNAKLEVIESKNTKTGEDIWVVRLSDRVERSVYDDLNGKAKKLGGYYSSYRGNGAIPGFIFKSPDQAQKFVNLQSEDVSNVDKAEERQEEKIQNRAAKLRENAEKIIERVDTELSRDRLTNTAKRAGQAASTEARLAGEKRIAETMLNIANAIDNGDVKLLDGIKAKTHIELLDEMLRNAKRVEIDAKYGTESYSEKERNGRSYEPITIETVEYLKQGYFPSLYGSRLKDLIKKASTKAGVKLIAARWEKKIARLGEYDSYQVTSDNEVNDIAEMVKAVGGSIYDHTHIKNAILNHNRLKSMGIENDSMLRAALREYIQFRGKNQEVDKVKQLERALVGNKNLGIDFFPTPMETARIMVDEAGIAEGMDVLEPSAGNGNIADAIKEAGVMPDVIEISSKLAEVLEAKGYDVVATDFMEYSGKQYDRIVMNPPFSNGMDGEHVQHAYELLKPGGKIVAIVGEGTFIRSDKKAVAFREWLEEVGGTEEKLESGTFHDKKLLNTTGANARMVVIEKPIESPMYATDKKKTFLDTFLDKFKTKEQIVIDEAQEVVNAINEASNYDDEIVLMDNAETVKDLRKNGYNGITEDILRKSWRGLSLNSKIYVHPRIAKDKLFVAATTVHEKVHNYFNDKFSKRYKREAYFDNLYKAIGEAEIKKVIPFQYWIEYEFTQAEEYITHISEALVYKIAENKDQTPETILNELLSGVKDNTVKKAIFEAINETINLNNLQNVINTNFTNKEYNQAKQPDGRTKGISTDNSRDRLYARTEGTLRPGSDGVGRETLEKPSRKQFPFLTDFLDAAGKYFALRTPAKPFYSPTEKALTRINQNKGTAEQFKAMLLKNGAKQAELDWMGFDEQFSDPKQSVTKADIQSWIDGNKVEVEEVTKGASRWEGNELIDNGVAVANLVHNEDGTWSFESDFSEGEETYETREDAMRDAEEATVGDTFGETSTKYSQYQLPGGENYREVLLTMPEKPTTPEYIIKKQYFDQHNKVAEYEKTAYQIEEGENYIDRRDRYFNSLKDDKIYQSLIKEEKRLSKLFYDKPDNRFKSSHFDEPNVVAHIRLKEYNTTTEKILMLEEIQSDISEKIRQLEILVKSGKITQNDITELERLKKITPFHNTTQWVNLALRRMIRYAAENGFDRVAWTTGEMQAERYDLSKQVDKIEYSRDKKQQLTDIRAYKKGEQIHAQNDLTDSQLEETIGKEATKKIIDQNKTFGELTGDDLKVGGTGMKTFYDAIVPNAAKELGKKFGAKVEEITIKPGINYTKKVLSLPITESMRETAIYEGMPYFALLGETGAANLDNAYDANERLNNLSLAKEMEKQGKSPKEILLATGWQRGNDNKFKYETPDLKPKIDIQELRELPKQADGYTAEIPLTELVEDSELFKAYPQLKDTKIVFYETNLFSEQGGFADSQKNIIGIGTARPEAGQVQERRNLRNEVIRKRPDKAYDNATLKSLLSHEVQHIIQQLEGFARGGNIDKLWDYLIESEIKQLEKDPKLAGLDDTRKRAFAETNVEEEYGSKIHAYNRLAGEIESQSVQDRLNLTPEERRNRLLSEESEISKEEQIYLYNSLYPEQAIIGEQGAANLDKAEREERLKNANIGGKNSDMNEVIRLALIAQNYSDAAKGVEIYNEDLHSKQIRQILKKDRDYNKIKDDLYYEKNKNLLKAAKLAQKANVDVFLSEDSKGYEVLYFEFPFGQVSFHFYNQEWIDKLPSSVKIEPHKWDSNSNSGKLLRENLNKTESIITPKAEEATTRLDNLKVAKEMETSGNVTPKNIEELFSDNLYNDLQNKKTDILNIIENDENDVVKATEILNLLLGTQIVGGGGSNYKKIQIGDKILTIRISDHIGYDADIYINYPNQANIPQTDYMIDMVLDKKNRSIEDINDEDEGVFQRLFFTLPKFEEFSDAEDFIIAISNRIAYLHKDMGIDFNTIKSKSFTPKQILLATGWQRGADGKWRYEIDDNFTVNSDLPNDFMGNLGDLIDYPELFKAHPELKDYQVILITNENEAANQGIFENYGTPIFKFINLQLKDGKGDGNINDIVKGTVLHEIQHSIQQINGFATGTDKEQAFKNYIQDYYKRMGGNVGTKQNELYGVPAETYDKAVKEGIERFGVTTNDELAYALYKQNAGETEARNAESRLNYTPEQRRQTLLEETEDVSRKDQIFIYDSLGASLSTPPPTNFLDDKLEAIAAKMQASAQRNARIQKMIDDFHAFQKANENTPPPTPPIEPVKPKKTEPSAGKEVEKTIVTERTYKGEVKEAIRKKLEEIGLTRNVQSQKEAEEIGLSIIKVSGLENALEAVREGDVQGAPAGAIFHEKLKSINDKMNSETNPEIYDRLAKEYADITEEMGKIATLYGQYNAFFNYIYQTSDLGFNAEKMIKDYKEVNNGEISAELEAKFKQLEKDFRDVSNKLAEAEKKAKEQADKETIDSIKASIERDSKRKTKTSEQIRVATDKILATIEKGKIHRPGIFAAASPASLAWDLGLETVKTAIKATGRTIEAIAKGWEAITSTDWYKGLDADTQKQAKVAFNEFFADTEEKADKKEKKDKSTYSITPKGLKIPHSIIRDFVEQGIDNIEELTTAIHSVIIEEYPEITEREVRDAITGYGLTMSQNQDEIEKEIRKMKDLGRVLSGLEDVEEGERPLRSGLQRDKPDPDTRAAHKKLREAMKLLPIDEQLRLDQQKTQLDADKTRLRNQIEDLQREIDKGEQTPRNVRTKQEDEELKGLIIARDAKKKEHDAIFKNEDFLNRKRVELSKKAIERRIKELEKRISDGDFAPKQRKELIADTELIRLRAEKLRIQEEYKKEMHKAKLRNRTQAEKIKDGLWDAWGITRALRATGEFSFVGIQGLINTIAHPIQAKEAFKTSMKLLLSQEKADDWMNNLKSQEWYPMLKESKLAITEPNAEITAREELFYSGWTNFVWNSVGKMLGRNPELWQNYNPLRAIERAAVGYLDTQRVLRYLDGVEMLKEKGIEFNQANKQAYVEMADVINTFTGRGSIGRLDPELLTKIFFSPRNWSSVIKSATPYAFYHFGKKRAGAEAWKPSVAQKMALADFSKFVGLTTSIVALAALALNGDDDDENMVELDPRSTDFGKIKIGDTRIDPWGGRIQQIVMISRLINDSTKNTYGEIVPVGTPYKSPTRAELLLQMATNKLAPSASMIYRYLSSKVDKDGNRVDTFGEPYSLPEAIVNNLYPIYWETLSELAEDDITALDGLLAAYAFFGGGVMVYGGGDSPEKEFKTEVRRAEALIEKMDKTRTDKSETEFKDWVKKNRNKIDNAIDLIEINKTVTVINKDIKYFDKKGDQVKVEELNGKLIDKFNKAKEKY